MLSVTSFIDTQLTFTVLYGCTRNTRKLAEIYLKQVKASDHAWHPLILPMLFAELERKRLLNLLDLKQVTLQQSILETEIRGTEATLEVVYGNIAAGVKGYELTKNWINVSKLKNGLERLKTQLVSMTEHSRMLCQSVLGERRVEPIIRSRSAPAARQLNRGSAR